jgi:DNA-binding CsgD family transcriptional regulator
VTIAQSGDRLAARSCGVDIRGALDLVSDLGGLEDPAGFPALALPALARLIPCDVLTYNEIDLTRQSVTWTDEPVRALDPASEAVFAAHVHEHPLVQHYRATGDSLPAAISDFLSRREFHRLGLYSEFFRPVRLEHQLAVTVCEPGATVIGLAFNRERRDFSQGDRDLLTLLRGPLVTGLLRARRRHAAAQALRLPDYGQLGELTEREAQILYLVATGRTNVAIGHALGISARTVAKHLENTYRKLGVSGRTAAVRLAGSPGAGAEPAAD